MVLHHKQIILQAALGMTAVVHSSLQCSLLGLGRLCVTQKKRPHEAAHVEALEAGTGRLRTSHASRQG